MQSLQSVLALTAVIVLLPGCESAVAPDGSYTLEIVSGQNQQAGAGMLLPQPVVARVFTKDGRPVPGAIITWYTLDGAGTVDKRNTPTDADGRAAVQWTLGSDLGAQQLLASSLTASGLAHATGIFRIAAVAAGFRHSCALTSSGVAYCWGTNTEGQLGDGSLASSPKPVRVSTQLRFRQIATGWSHSCGLTFTGDVYCWGDNSVGQAGFDAPRSAVPAASGGTDAFAAITVGFIHTCGVTLQGDVVCWGGNDQGQLGGSQMKRVRISGQQVQSIAAGEFHTCALRTAGGLLCWGWNSAGELGTGTAAGAVANTPAIVAGNLQAIGIAAGVRHSCALAADGRAFCWGRNAVGETGQDPLVAVATPVQVPGDQSFSAIVTGNTHTCALAGSRAYCWGASPANGSTAATKTPLPLDATLQFSSIAAGYEHSCGLVNGDVWCWGSNSHGQLGQTGMAESAAALRVTF